MDTLKVMNSSLALMQGTGVGVVGEGILECFNNMHSDKDELLKFRRDRRRANRDEHTRTAIHLVIIIMSLQFLCEGYSVFAADIKTRSLVG